MGDRSFILLLVGVLLTGCMPSEKDFTPNNMVRLKLSFALEASSKSRLNSFQGANGFQEVSSDQSLVKADSAGHSNLRATNQSEPCAEAMLANSVPQVSPVDEPVRGFFHNSSQAAMSEQGHLSLLQVDKLWAVSRGNGITVAVIDSGVNLLEPSLQGAVLPGYDFLRDTACMHDDNGHGTAIASIIAGRGPEWGIAPEAKILPLRVLNQDREGSSFHVARAVLFAANLLEDMPNPYPAQLINLSLGANGISPDLRDAIIRVRQNGVLVVAAAGNDSLAVAAFPAALPDVLSVGAAEVIHGSWRLTPYSNRVDDRGILAPMGGLTDTNWGRYAEAGILARGQRVHGTSFAAAQVSAIAALMLSLVPDADSVWQYLLLSATSYGDTAEKVVNPVAALSALMTTNQQPLVVRFLDAGSLQEILRLYADTELDALLPPGRYYVQVWHDVNQDGLWQDREANFFLPEVLDLYPGQFMMRHLRVTGCC